MLCFKGISYTPINFFLHRGFPDLDHRLAIDEIPMRSTILMSNTPVFIRLKCKPQLFFIFHFFLLKFCITKITDCFLFRSGDYNTINNNIIIIFRAC